MPPLVRRAPLSARIAAALNPWDWLLWVSEELNGSEWEDKLKEWALPLGIVMNFVFLIARANMGNGGSGTGDDVFGDYEGKRGSGWLVWFASFVVHLLSLLALTNAFYTFYRKRHYRLFEQNIDAPPSTPSAHRVRVDSSPISSSPLRFINNIIASTSAESRAHPDAARDVWELAVWDPTPACLRLFCTFSPGHVLVYWLFLPVAPLNPRSSVTVVTTIILELLLSLQLSMLQSSFSQQAKDAALIHKEVLHEYDTKFVHPSLNRPVRDVGTQTRTSSTASPGFRTAEVDIYTPTTVINRGFRTNPNPNYASQYDPDGATSPQKHMPRSTTTPSVVKTPLNNAINGGVLNGYNGFTTQTDFSSPLRSRPTTALRQPQFRDGGAVGDGGSLGVYSHAASPLRKTVSTNHLRPDRRENGIDARERRSGSPLKRMSTPSGGAGVEERSRGYSQLGIGRRESGRY
ncbi:hypothetical protein B0A49_00535 [Cryomyces minteri]|uniref:Meiotically up-regulated gene 154 protein n=1 Tax=Cryomyces minteri TaxID=331657 RepID=A0A4U0Y018_9PEZI|nr:hypothetical protein B0A49_00535 [Cryomyces minteri]